MSVLLDTFAYGTTTSGTTASATIAVANNSNRALIALAGDLDTTDITNIKYNGGADFTFLGNFVDSSRCMEIWYSLAPAVTTHQIDVTFAGTIANAGLIGVYSVYNADSIEAYSESTTDQLSLTVAGATGDMQLCFYTSNANATISVGTLSQGVNLGTYYWRWAYNVDAPDPTFTFSALSRGFCGCNVKAAAGSSAAPFYYYAQQ